MTDTTTPEKNTAETLMTLDEVGDYLRISRWSVYQLINDRRLTTVRIGTRRLVTPEDFHDFLTALRAEGARHGR